MIPPWNGCRQQFSKFSAKNRLVLKTVANADINGFITSNRFGRSRSIVLKNRNFLFYRASLPQQRDSFELFREID
jgi:hypothetical protein